MSAGERVAVFQAFFSPNLFHTDPVEPGEERQACGFECVSSHFVIRLSTSCLSWLCRDTPTLCSRNKPIPFLYFQSTFRMYLYLCVYIERDSTCSIGQERQQLEDTKPPGERGQPKYKILFCPKKISSSSERNLKKA